MNVRRAPKRRAYDRTLREAEALKTRAAIVEAATGLLRRIRPEQLSLAEVANLADVSVRTVYRHFATPTELVQAAAQDFLGRTLAPLGPLPEKLADLPPSLSGLQRLMSEQPSIYPLFFALPARSGVGFAERVKSWARGTVEKVPDEHHAAVNGLVELLTSPYAWEVLHSHWKLPPERITRACIAALQSVLDGIERHPDWLDPEAPPPPRFRKAPR